MKLLSLEIGEQFRSLHPGFKINFHQLTDKDVEAMMQFQPFCFAGLNGSGKSNVLECLAAIFYHLEMCVAKFKPSNFQYHFRPEKCVPETFTIKYLISSPGLETLLNNRNEIKAYTNIVTITKEKEKKPIMTVHPFEDSTSIRTFELIPFEDSKGKATAKSFLPDLVVGYSSGENEILSHPFIKNRLIHFDEYKEAIDKRPFKEPETSLLYIDEEMSQAVLLACLLFEDPDTTLMPLHNELGITDILSFRMNINLVQTGFAGKEDNSLVEMKPLLNHFNKELERLKSCSTSHYYSKRGKKTDKNDSNADRLVMDFFVGKNSNGKNKSTELLRKEYKTAFGFFRIFQTLYELNYNIVSDAAKEEVYGSKGVYTEGKLSSPGPEERAFHFLDFKILKKIEGIEEPKELLLREFSDGEHQFLHTMCICLMLKDNRTLLLLDEPETHFNPSWRAKFIKVLNDSLKAGGTNHFLKDIIITSHSPFIISDCLPNNVILFKKDDKRKIITKTASEFGFNTYGASVDLILQEIFGMYHSISEHALEEIRILLRKKTVDPIIEGSKLFGESYEKGFLYERIEELKSVKKKKSKK